jgi:hypothetical protein
MKTSIASVPKSAILISSMKAFLTAVIFLAVAVSVHAQGQIVGSGSGFATQASYGPNDYNQTVATEMVMTMVSIPILYPTPPTGSASGLTASLQPSSLAIQAVPEPSSFVLLAVGLLTGTTIFSRSRISARR